MYLFKIESKCLIVISLQTKECQLLGTLKWCFCKYHAYLDVGSKNNRSIKKLYIAKATHHYTLHTNLQRARTQSYSHVLTHRTKYVARQSVVCSSVLSYSIWVCNNVLLFTKTYINPCSVNLSFIDKCLLVNWLKLTICLGSRMWTHYQDSIQMIRVQADSYSYLLTSWYLLSLKKCVPLSVNTFTEEFITTHVQSFIFNYDLNWTSSSNMC